MVQIDLRDIYPLHTLSFLPNPFFISMSNLNWNVLGNFKLTVWGYCLGKFDFLFQNSEYCSNFTTGRVLTNVCIKITSGVPTRSCVSSWESTSRCLCKTKIGPLTLKIYSWKVSGVRIMNFATINHYSLLIIIFYYDNIPRVNKSIFFVLCKIGFLTLRKPQYQFDFCRKSMRGTSKVLEAISMLKFVIRVF